MTPTGEVWVCVRITTQLVVIDSNHHLSRIVRNLTEPPHHSNTEWNMMVIMVI
jgi:hypothetical protein